MNINVPKKLDQKDVDLYLKMIAESLCFISYNQGAQRKEIWKYVHRSFKKVDYQTFLLSINQLLTDGKMKKNDNGYYFIEGEIYKEMTQLYEEGKKSQGKMSTGAGKGSTNKGSVGGLPVDNLRKPCSIDNIYKNMASNGKNYSGGFDRGFPAKIKSGGKISQMSTKLGSNFRNQNGQKKGSAHKNSSYSDPDFNQFMILPCSKEIMQKGGEKKVIPDINKDPMEDISKRIMDELKRQFPDRKGGKKTGNVTPCITEEKGPGAKMPDGKKRKDNHSKNLLGFQQASAEYSQEQDIKNDRIDLFGDEEEVKKVRKQKEEKQLFGLTSPSITDEEQNPKSNKHYQDLQTPEDLYPKSQRETNQHFQDTVKEEDLNFNSDDERLENDLQGPLQCQESSIIKTRPGKKRQRNTNFDQQSQISTFSRYSLRPRGENSRVYQFPSSQSKKPTVISVQKKVIEKQNRKEQLYRSQREMSQREFKQPIGRASADKIDTNMLSGEQHFSDQSSKTIQGFGAYNTRTYKTFAEATQKKVLTRQSKNEVINNRPSLEKIIDNKYMVDSSNKLSQGYNYVGQKRNFNQMSHSQFEKPNRSSMQKISNSRSHFTNFNSSRRSENQSIQRKKMMVHQRVQQENVLKRTKISSSTVKNQFTQGQPISRNSPKQPQLIVDPIVVDKPKLQLNENIPSKEHHQKGSHNSMMSQMSTRSRRTPPENEIIQKQKTSQKEEEFHTQSGRQTAKRNYKDANKQGYTIVAQPPSQVISQNPVKQNLPTVESITRIANMYGGQQPHFNVNKLNNKPQRSSQIQQAPPQNAATVINSSNGKPETQSQSTSISGEQQSQITPQKRLGQKTHLRQKQSSGQKKDRESKIVAMQNFSQKQYFQQQ